MKILLTIFVIGWLLPFEIGAQTALTERTGKSYETAEPKRLNTIVRQFPSPVTFTDFTAASKIDFRHAASPTSQKYLLETMGAGVALIDYDNDGRLDIFFTNGAELADARAKNAKPVKSDAKFWNRLYRQKPDGTFEDKTEKAGVKGEGYAFGAAVGDYNRDGLADLLVTRFGGATLYRNRGDGTFEDATQRLNISVDGWATSAGFFDYDRDGKLDIFIARYMLWDFEAGKLFCGEKREGMRAYCHPDNFKSVSNVLLRQKSDGTFEDTSAVSGIAQTAGKNLGVAFADFDDDGWTDVFVANDNQAQQLFKNLGDGKFEETALLAGAAYNENGKSFAGMGVDAHDYDGDGKMDVIVTGLANDTYPLYRNRGEMVFDVATNSTNVAQITALNSGWGIKFADFDNDGKADVFAAQSHVLDTIEKSVAYLKYKQPPLLLRGDNKIFQNVSDAAGAIFRQNLAARGLAIGDLDNDGDADAVIAQTDGAAVVLKNAGTKNHWLGIDLRGGDKSSARGENARVAVVDETGKKQFFDVSNAGSYLSANDSRLLVGLGAANAVRSIEIRWTSGKIQKLENPPIDCYLTVTEN